jgi:hypothetical protein
VWVGRSRDLRRASDSIAAGDPALRTNRGAELAKEQHGCRLAGVVGGLPVPGAGRVGGAEGRLHGATQNSGIDATAAFEHGERRGDAAGKRFGHGRNSFGEQEWVEPSGALLCPRRLKPFPARLSLSAVPNKNGDQRYTPVPKQPRDGQSRPAL